MIYYLRPEHPPLVTEGTRREQKIQFITHIYVERQVPQTNELFEKPMTKCDLSEGF